MRLSRSYRHHDGLAPSSHRRAPEAAEAEEGEDEERSKGNKMRYLLAGLIPVWLLYAASTHSVLADAIKGGQLAQQWCASCHIIGDSPAISVQQSPPSFRAIAHGGITDEQLRAFLSHPHGAMPDLSLTRAEIDDLIGYIDKLR